MDNGVVKEAGAKVPAELLEKLVKPAKPTRVAIVALGPSSLKYIQRASNWGSRDKFHEVWTVNSYADVIASDRLFHMDDFLVQEARAAAGNFRVGNMLEAIKRYKGPVITCRPLERYPTSVEFPLGKVIAEFGCCYFNHTVPYMLAYAGWLGVEEISLFGCDYSWPDRTMAEKGRACTEYWMGQLNARGIVTRVEPDSTLLDAFEYNRDSRYPIYGYCDGHDVTLEELGEGKVRLKIVEKETLPSAAEVEKKYDHGKETNSVLPEIEAFQTGPQG